MLIAKVIVYSTLTCPFCDRAKDLLQAKGVAYEEIRVDTDVDKLMEMRTKSGRRTVPQIFINEQHIGGFDDLKTLNEQGKLEALLRPL